MAGTVVKQEAVRLREVVEADLPVFYEQQLDPEASRVAAFPSKDRTSFTAHWARIMSDDTVVIRTILFEGQVAGSLVSFLQDGRREVGYWLGREFWGKGIATQALAAFLAVVQERPLFAYTAKHNLASIRVLEKCGFRRVGMEKDFSLMDGKAVEGVVMMLRAGEREEG
jgi:RimJ/RimL family protein N-acetyltransferase